MPIGSVGRTAIIGLGQMGLPMAVNLKKAGVEIVCHDPGETVRSAAGSEGLELAAGVAEAFRSANFVVLSLPNAKIVQAVVTEGLAALDGPAPLIIDTSTSTAEMTRQLAPRLEAAGGAFVDAPVSGGPSGSREGTLTFMVGGAAADVERCRPLFDILGKAVLHAGSVGAGNIAKLVNNLMVAGHMLIAREGLAMAEAAGLDSANALEVVNAASGGSTVSRVHVPTWVLTRRFDSGFTMGLMRKDIRLAVDLAAEHGVDLPVGDAVAALWQAQDAPEDAADFTHMGDPKPLTRTSKVKQ